MQNNCALGGTGSELGNYRFTKHVAATELLICEFTLNDKQLVIPTAMGETVDRSAYRTMTGIVKQARAFNPNVALFFSISPLRDFPTGTTDLHLDFIESRETTLRFVNNRKIPYSDLVDTFFYQPIPSGFDPLPLPGPAALPPAAGSAGGGPLDALSSSGGWTSQVNQEDWVTYPFFSNQQALFAGALGDQLSVPFYGRTVGLWFEWHYGSAKISARLEIKLDGTVLGMYSSQHQSGELPLRRFLPPANGLDPAVPHTLELRVMGAPSGTLRLALHGITIGR